MRFRVWFTIVNINSIIAEIMYNTCRPNNGTFHREPLSPPFSLVLVPFYLPLFLSVTVDRRENSRCYIPSPLRVGSHINSRHLRVSLSPDRSITACVLYMEYPTHTLPPFQTSKNPHTIKILLTVSYFTLYLLRTSLDSFQLCVCVCTCASYVSYICDNYSWMASTFTWAKISEYNARCNFQIDKKF